MPLALRCRGDDPDALAAKLSSLSKTVSELKRLWGCLLGRRLLPVVSLPSHPLLMREHPLDMSLESFVCPRVTLVHGARCLRALPACTPSAARPVYSHTRAPENFKCKPDVMCTTHRPCLPARPQPPDLLPHPHPHLQPNPLAPLCPHPPHPRFVSLCFVVVSCDVMRREPRSIVALCVVRE